MTSGLGLSSLLASRSAPGHVIPSYTLTVADTLTDSVIAPAVPIRGLRYTRRLNDTGTLEAVLDIVALRKQGAVAADIAQPVKRTFYLYRDEFPVWGGVLTSASYDSSDDAITLRAADWFWVLDRRPILPDPATLPPAKVAERVVSFVNTDQNDIVRELLRLAQLGASRDLLLTGTAGLSAAEVDPRERTYAGYEMRSTGESLRQLANVIDGPDLRFDVAYTSASPTPQRILKIGTPYLGADGGPLVWEYGGNLIDYTFPLDPSEHADRFYAMGDGGEVGTPIEMAERSTDLGDDTLNWPALDAWQSYSNVIEPARLRDHAIDELWRRTGYRTVISATVRGNRTPMVGTYEPGNYAQLVANTGFHALSSIARIVGDTVEVTEDAGEVVGLDLAPIASSGGAAEGVTS